VAADTGPYTRDELREAAGKDPTRGPVCDRCKAHIPQFQDLSTPDEERVRYLIRQQQPIMAMRELMAATGCPSSWAKLWVLQSGRPQPRFPGPPCRFCGKPLASSRARQCLSCGADWHHEPRET
jgi:hypothetical protein